MEAEQIWRYVDAERAALAEVLAGLTEAEWSAPSVCPGWTVREVAAHVISSPQARVLPVLGGMVRARGDFNRFVFEEARRAGARCSGEEIVAQYSRFAGSRRRPLGTTVVDPLLDVLVHTQDIVLPLGRSHEMPVEAAVVAADRVWRKSFPFRARQRLAGVRLVASDIDWSVGAGDEIRGPVAGLLLLLTGRRPERLTGTGIERLQVPR
ncbi:maleylpyruvate isomerase family mycothiol-dependent enzyme [Kribbella sp. CA-293567]|uniref:maleylpyruvate isomerase family mycothiol-dependent enzyme n=1 Tax=Kribbella sp. CA-293567 TaxID=3002436 RepID=UPI0022DCFA98|nr:maleylpyruvate isomerase family mycothiol-dependent enzyme [Kribbella sp. CA-293567]WBQ07162.1 maleylpyruvate isomerase family mycothiol-dependent enzyme [Kribbella sp. CA-293567]